MRSREIGGRENLYALGLERNARTPTYQYYGQPLSATRVILLCAVEIPRLPSRFITFQNSVCLPNETNRSLLNAVGETIREGFSQQSDLC